MHLASLHKREASCAPGFVAIPRDERRQARSASQSMLFLFFVVGGVVVAVIVVVAGLLCVCCCFIFRGMEVVTLATPSIQATSL